jgi:carboxyl-terminal processing protease
MSKLRILGTLGVGVVLALVLIIMGGSLRTSVASPSYQDLALLANVLHLVKQHYVTDVDEHELVEGALKGMLDTLDPHTSYLAADLYREVQLDTKGEFEGLGIEITKRDGYVTVVSPIDGTPAQRAGIRARDQIVAVCPDVEDDTTCKSTQDMNLIEAVKMMRGPRGTKILVQVMRQGWPVPRPFVIKRDSIRVSSVTMQMIEPGIPYIRLSQFQERTAGDLRAALEAAIDNEPIEGLVLDLRDNPGGLLDQAVQVADLFVGDGLIVFSEGRGGGNRMEWNATRDRTQPEYPMVVLVNGGSASASEIVAGALQDHKRALVLGGETFGKGSVQTIIPLDDGSGLRLTTALYYLPSGRSIQEVRIQPDVEVEPLSDAEIEALEEGEQPRSFGEEDLEGHIVKDEKPKKEDEASRVDARREAFERQLQIDRQLTRAVDLLKSWNVFSNLQLKKAS